MKTNDGGGGRNRRGGGVPYRLAWNDEVKISADLAAVRNANVDNSDNIGAVDGGKPTGHEDDDRVKEGVGLAAVDAAAVKGNAIDPRLSSPAATERLAPAPPLGRNKTAGMMVQLPRPVEGDEASSTTPDGNGGCGYDGRGFGCSSLLSGSDSRGWQSLLEENKCSTSRVIANLRASVDCETRPSSARIHSSAAAPTAEAAAAGPGLFPVAVLEVRQGGTAIAGRTAYSSRVGPHDEHVRRSRTNNRPQSAAGSTTAVRLSRNIGGGGGGRGGGRHRNVTTSGKARTHLNVFADDAVDGTVSATECHLGGQRGVGTANVTGNRQQNGSRRAHSAGTNSSANRRRRDLRAQNNYSFFPSASNENASECDQHFDGISGHNEPFLGGVTSAGDVGEWEDSLCSSAEARSRVGYDLDSQRTWREAVGF